MNFTRGFFDTITGSPWRWLIICALVLLALTRNLPWHLDDYDQAKQAYVSFEMLEQGAWWFQHTPDGLVATKPPLIGWISAGLRALGLPWDVAWRLPGIVAALVIGIILYHEAEKLWPRYGGVSALCVFLLNMLAIRLVTLVRTDMPLTVTVFLLGWVLYRQIRDGGAWRSWRGGLIIAALALSADFTKGPIFYAFLLPGAVLMAVVAWRRDLFERPWHWLAGFVLWSLPGLFLFLDWSAAASIWEPAFYEEVVVKEFLGRFTAGHEAVHNNQPLYFYVVHLLHKFAPWSVALLVLPWWKEARRAIRARPEVLWLVLWALGGLVVMSLIPSKRVDRIFPIIPPLAMLLPFMLRALAEPVAAPTGESGGRARAWAGIMLGLALVVWGGYGLGQVAARHARGADQLVRFGREARHLADLRHVTLGVVKAYDEGLLLYTRTPRFLEREEAVEKWREGQVRGLVMDRETAQKLRDKLEFIEPPVFLIRDPRERGEVRYVLVFKMLGDPEAAPGQKD